MNTNNKFVLRHYLRDVVAKEECFTESKMDALFTTEKGVQTYYFNPALRLLEKPKCFPTDKLDAIYADFVDQTKLECLIHFPSVKDFKKIKGRKEKLIAWCRAQMVCYESGFEKNESYSHKTDSALEAGVVLEVVNKGNGKSHSGFTTNKGIKTAKAGDFLDYADEEDKEQNQQTLVLWLHENAFGLGKTHADYLKYAENMGFRKKDLEAVKGTEEEYDELYKQINPPKEKKKTQKELIAEKDAEIEELKKKVAELEKKLKRRVARQKKKEDTNKDDDN